MPDRIFGWAFIVFGVASLLMIPLSLAAGDGIWPISLLAGAGSIMFGIGVLRRIR